MDLARRSSRTLSFDLAGIIEEIEKDGDQEEVKGSKGPKGHRKRQPSVKFEGFYAGVQNLRESTEKNFAGQLSQKLTSLQTQCDKFISGRFPGFKAFWNPERTMCAILLGLLFILFLTSLGHQAHSSKHIVHRGQSFTQVRPSLSTAELHNSHIKQHTRRLESKRTDRSLLPKQILATESQESPNLPTGTLNSGTEVKIEPVIKQENRPMVKEIRKPVMEQKIGPISSVSQFQSETLPKTEEKLTQNVNTQKISNSKPFMNTTQFHMGNVSKIEGPEAKLTQNINTHKLSNSSIGDGDSKGKVNALLQPEVIEKLASLELPALPEEVLEDGHGETQNDMALIEEMQLAPTEESILPDPMLDLFLSGASSVVEFNGVIEPHGTQEKENIDHAVLKKEKVQEEKAAGNQLVKDQKEAEQKLKESKERSAKTHIKQLDERAALEKNDSEKRGNIQNQSSNGLQDPGNRSEKLEVAKFQQEIKNGAKNSTEPKKLIQSVDGAEGPVQNSTKDGVALDLLQNLELKNEGQKLDRLLVEQEEANRLAQQAAEKKMQRHRDSELLIREKKEAENNLKLQQEEATKKAKLVQEQTERKLKEEQEEAQRKAKIEQEELERRLEEEQKEVQRKAKLEQEEIERKEKIEKAERKAEIERQNAFRKTEEERELANRRKKAEEVKRKKIEKEEATMKDLLEMAESLTKGRSSEKDRVGKKSTYHKKKSSVIPEEEVSDADRLQFDAIQALRQNDQAQSSEEKQRQASAEAQIAYLRKIEQEEASYQAEIDRANSDKARRLQETEFNAPEAGAIQREKQKAISAENQQAYMQQIEAMMPALQQEIDEAGKLQQQNYLF